MILLPLLAYCIPVEAHCQTKIRDDASEIPLDQDVPGLDVPVCDHWLPTSATDLGVKVGESGSCRVGHDQLKIKKTWLRHRPLQIKYHLIPWVMITNQKIFDFHLYWSQDSRKNSCQELNLSWIDKYWINFGPIWWILGESMYSCLWPFMSRLIPY